MRRSARGVAASPARSSRRASCCRVIAGIAGFLLAWVALPVLITIVPDGLPRIESIRIDATVAVFSVAVVFVTALLAGIAPGLFSMRGDLVSPLRGSSAAIAGTATRGRRLLVVGQVALAVTVLAAAGLLIRSVLNLQAIDLGLAAERLVAGRSASAIRGLRRARAPRAVSRSGLHAARSGAWDLGRDPSQRCALYRSRMGRATSHCRRTRATIRLRAIRR